MERILIMIAADSWQDAKGAILSAVRNAGLPQRLSWGICLMEEPDEQDALQIAEIGTVSVRVPQPSAWTQVNGVWKGQTYILVTHPAMRFRSRWDVQLPLALRRCKGRNWGNCALTGFPPSPIDPVDAVSPVAAECFDTAGSICYHKGTPLRYAHQPMASAFLNPNFCFGPAAFARGLSRRMDKDEPMFLSAFRAGWHLFTLHKPVVTMEWDMPVLPDNLQTLDRSVTNRFRERFGVDLKHRHLGAMSRLGIYTADYRFPMRIPMRYRIRAALAAKVHQPKRTAMCVTMKVGGYSRTHMLDDESYVRFSRLAAVKSIPLVCYADGENGRKVQPVLNNVMEYKDRYGLPVEANEDRNEIQNRLGAGKVFLLKQARERYLTYSHYVWIAFDYLRYPVYEHVKPDWRQVLKDRIVIALVNGMPDTSVICVPQGMIGQLCAAVSAVCENNRRMTGHYPAETALWQQLMHEHPDWFDAADMPARYNLFDCVVAGRERTDKHLK